VKRSMAHPTSLESIYRSFLVNRNLIRQMVKREVLSRYRGSMVGIAWSFFNPLLMLGVYTFFFSYIYNSKWGTDEPEAANFSVVMFAGLIIHGLFAECINRAPSLISMNVSFVKKVVFPLEVFPIIALGTALFHAVISVFVLMLLHFITVGQFHWTVILFPLVIAPFFAVLLGTMWFLAATGVYVKDIAQTTSIATSVLLFISPVFYPITMLPHQVRWLVMINPLTLVIEETRNVLLFGKIPNFGGLAIYYGVAAVVAWGGYTWFQRSRRGFADVL
jgi:lipopolysaccharide transport system permease protein